MTEDPVRINRLHAVWPNQITAIERILPDAPDGWLQVRTNDGNWYQTELGNKPDPECPVDPRELCSRIEALTGVKATTYYGGGRKD